MRTSEKKRFQIKKIRKKQKMKKQIRFFSKNQSPNLEPKWYPKPADNEVEPNRLFHFAVGQIWVPFWFQILGPTFGPVGYVFYCFWFRNDRSRRAFAARGDLLYFPWPLLLSDTSNDSKPIMSNPADASSTPCRINYYDSLRLVSHVGIGGTVA